MGRSRKLLRGLRQHPWVALGTFGLVVLLGLSGSIASGQLRALYHYRLAQRALERLDFARAREHLEVCLAAWSASAETHFLAARTARRAGAYDDAKYHLKLCQRLGWVPEAIELERVLLWVQRGELAGLEGYLLDCVQRGHPESELLLEALAEGSLKTYRLPQARYYLGLWLERQPENVRALFLRGQVEERMNRMQEYLEALADYRRVLELDPEHEQARLALAQALLYCRRAGEAEEHFAILQRRKPRNIAVRLGLAHCCQELGRTEQACEHFRALLAEYPRDPQVLGEWGKLLLQTGQAAGADGWLRKALALAPQDRELNYAFYQCLLQEGKGAEAKESLAKLEHIENGLRRVAELTMKVAEAPRDPAPRYEIGMIFLETGQEQEGLRWLASALQEDPGHQPSHLALAAYYERNSDPAQAAHHRQLAYQAPVQAPGNPFRQPP